LGCLDTAGTVARHSRETCPELVKETMTCLLIGLRLLKQPSFSADITLRVLNGGDNGNCRKTKKRWFLKAELVVFVCVICIWAVKSATVDIDTAAPEQQQVIIDQQLLQILQGQFEQTKKELLAQWQIEADALNKSWFSNRGQFETAKAKLNAKYQRLELDARAEIDRQIREIQQIQKLINDHKMSIQAGNEAVWRLVLPRETKAMFPMQEIFHPVIQKVITCILYTEKNPSVIIDHKILYEGDIIYGAKIAQIYKDKVEFEKNGQKWTQNVGEAPSPEWQ
jgi:hypothetical protein